MKKLTVVCVALAVAGLHPAFAEGKKKGGGHAVAARPAHGAPAMAHAHAAQHAAAPARMHARSTVVNGGAPAVRGIHGVNNTEVANRAARANQARAASVQQNVTVYRNANRNFAANRSTAPAMRNHIANYTDARRYWHHERHDRGWWGSHYNRLVLYGGGYYYWDNGWWYPAYGYDPYYSHYAFDGPIYGYNDLPPGDIVSDTQQALAQQGYYRGPIDGVLGPMTRRAIRHFQSDHGLAVTSAIDEPTLATLGLA